MTKASAQVKISNTSENLSDEMHIFFVSRKVNY